MNKNGYKLVIPLLGKGATNHLHRPEVVEAFSSRDIQVVFLVREDYLPALVRIPSCFYYAILLNHSVGLHKKISEMTRNIRMRYPSTDPGLNRRYKLMHLDNSPIGRLVDRFYCFLSRFKRIMHILLRIEGILSRHLVSSFPEECSQIEQLLLMGLGTKHSEIEGRLTWWAIRNGISNVHIVGNYDNLSGNGFRSAPISLLLVWGKSMRHDAEKLQDIHPSRIKEIGSIRYNALFSNKVNKSEHKFVSRSIFFSQLGLDPNKKTILFAGFIFESQYFEMLSCLQELREEGDDYQLILRIYPNKNLMSSIYIEPLLQYARHVAGVAVSLADPFFDKGEKGREVLQIEEYELWNGLRFCDCVINVYSTIAIEACLFDKPVLYMGYFPGQTGTLARQPVFFDYASNPHNRRLASYGATDTAYDRNQLKNMIREALGNPAKLAEARRRVVRDEIGLLDGKAYERLVEACVEEYKRTARK